jgi:hypothetical protein
MPDRDNWTAAMVLKWVLTRDEAAVLSMADIYGMVAILEDGTVSPCVAEDMDAVAIAYCRDETVATSTRTVVLRSQRVIAKRNAIYQALRRGQLEARARRNGTGDVETIARDQWLSLIFRSWDGHDLAVPINIGQDALKLPRALEDYLEGNVPSEMLPAVWPDPHFIASQVLQAWPRHKPTEVAFGVDALPRSAGDPVFSEAAERPAGVSDNDWEIFSSARKKGLNPNVWGNISKTARAIARDRGHRGEIQSERRAIHRVLEALRKKKLSDGRLSN